ncbi:hypothetical protein [Vibrio phage phiKT1024]|nr:hypothetical protein [Vibrio phage phiKT1024]
MDAQVAIIYYHPHIGSFLWKVIDETHINHLEKYGRLTLHNYCMGVSYDKGSIVVKEQNMIRVNVPAKPKYGWKITYNYDELNHLKTLLNNSSENKYKSGRIKEFIKDHPEEFI